MISAGGGFMGAKELIQQSFISTVLLGMWRASTLEVLPPSETLCQGLRLTVSTHDNSLMVQQLSHTETAFQTSLSDTESTL